MASADWTAAILAFWFDELKPEAWFRPDPLLDARILDRFGSLWREMSANPAAVVAETPARALAAILLFDQFSRNMFRGTAAAFASDPLALSIARQALAAGFAEGVEASRRTFLYLPFMHSEALEDQEESLRLFASIGSADALRYAEEHHAIIARFGRFPHRNRALGRPSTAEEEEFLVGHDGYGQRAG